VEDDSEGCGGGKLGVGGTGIKMIGIWAVGKWPYIQLMYTALYFILNLCENQTSVVQFSSKLEFPCETDI